MKLKLIRCSICHDWFSPFRSHCPNCGASEIAKGVYVDAGNTSRPGVLMACEQHNEIVNVLSKFWK